MSHTISVSLVQQRFTVGAIRENSQRVIDIAQAASTDLVLFPEMTLTGYPPEDLVVRPDLLNAVELGLQQICLANLDKILEQITVVGGKNTNTAILLFNECVNYPLTILTMVNEHANLFVAIPDD